MPEVPKGTPRIDLKSWAERISGAWQVLTKPAPMPGLGVSSANQDPRTPAVQPPAPSTPAPALPLPLPVGVTPMGGDEITNVSNIPALGQRSFGPLNPLEPRYSPESAEGQAPRRFQYPVGANILIQPRREYPDLTPFDQLRNLASVYDAAAMCIATRIEQVQGMGYSVVAKDKRKQRDFQDECEVVLDFFEKPDGILPFGTWLGIAIREHLVTDALTIFPKLTYGKDLARLNLVDGATFKPLLDDEGNVRAYQQILYGYPFSDYRQPMRDEEAEQEFPVYSTHELMYMPRFAAVNTPYGSPPTEWVILRVNQAIRKQIFDMAYFTEGNMPEMLATMPEGAMTPEQVEEFERYFNALLAGNDAARRKMKFIPWQASVQELRPFTYETTLDEWMLRVTCAAYAVPPQELGFTNDVNRATAELQEAVNERRGLKPLSTWLKRAIFDEVIRKYFAKAGSNGRNGKETATVSMPGQPTKPATNPFKKIEWSWSFGDKTDAQTVAQTDAVYIENEVLSKDEVRAIRFSDVVEGPAPLNAEEKAALKEEQANAVNNPAPPAGEGEAVPATAEVGAPPPAGAGAVGGAGVGAAAAGGPAPAGPTGVAGEAAPPAGEAVTAAITSEWRKIDETLDIRDPSERVLLERRVFDRVRGFMDKWAYNLARAVTVGNSPERLYDAMISEIRNGIRREIVDYQQDHNQRMAYDFGRILEPADDREAFVKELFDSILPVCLTAPLGGYVMKEQVAYVLSALLPSMAERASLHFPAALSRDLATMSKADLNTYQAAFGLWLNQTITQDAEWAMKVSNASHPLDLALTLANLEATRIYSAPLAHGITHANQLIRKATAFSGDRPLGGNIVPREGSETRIGDAPASAKKPAGTQTSRRTSAGSARAESEGGLVIIPPLHLHCRCKIRARKVSGVWLAIWWTNFADACTDMRDVPWGQVYGCNDLKNRCVTSGGSLGLRF